MKKIVLVYPEAYEISRYGKTRKEFPPFGILYLASVAEHAGFSVKILKISNNDYANDLKSRGGREPRGTSLNTQITQSSR
jgi:hypothetical protein